MSDKPDKKFCRMTKAEAIKAEEAIMRYSHLSVSAAKKHIKWLESKE